MRIVTLNDKKPASTFGCRTIARVLFATGLVAAGPASLGGGDGSGVEARPGQTFVYVCGESEFVTRIEGDVAWVFARSGTVRLPRVRSASGAKFQGEEAMLWSKGEEAMVTIDGTTYKDCRNDRRRAVWEDAKLRGADFRATGNEPGWVLEISQGTRISFNGDYGATRLELQSNPPVEDQAARQTRYTASDGNHRMSVVIEMAPCQDTMSGDSFSSRLTLNVDGRELHGCGRPLH